MSEDISAENYYKYRLNLIEEKINDENHSTKDKLISIIRGAVDTLYETSQGNSYKWPIRVSGSMIKNDDRLLINHLHFSYPITFYPQVRL